MANILDAKIYSGEQNAARKNGAKKDFGERMFRWRHSDSLRSETAVLPGSPTNTFLMFSRDEECRDKNKK